MIDFIEDCIVCCSKIPQTLTTDIGIMFVYRKMVRYVESGNIKLLASTPYYAQANGQHLNQSTKF